MNSADVNASFSASIMYNEANTTSDSNRLRNAHRHEQHHCRNNQHETEGSMTPLVEAGSSSVTLLSDASEGSKYSMRSTTSQSRQRQYRRSRGFSCVDQVVKSPAIPNPRQFSRCSSMDTILDGSSVVGTSLPKAPVRQKSNDLDPITHISLARSSIVIQGDARDFSWSSLSTLGNDQSSTLSSRINKNQRREKTSARGTRNDYSFALSIESSSSSSGGSCGEADHTSITSTPSAELAMMTMMMKEPPIIEQSLEDTLKGATFTPAPAPIAFLQRLRGTNSYNNKYNKGGKFRRFYATYQYQRRLLPFLCLMCLLGWSCFFFVKLMVNENLDESQQYQRELSRRQERTSGLGSSYFRIDNEHSGETQNVGSRKHVPQLLVLSSPSVTQQFGKDETKTYEKEVQGSHILRHSDYYRFSKQYLRQQPKSGNIPLVNVVQTGTKNKESEDEGIEDIINELNVGFAGTK